MPAHTIKEQIVKKRKKNLSVSLKQGAKRQTYLKSSHLADFDFIF